MADVSIASFLYVLCTLLPGLGFLELLVLELLGSGERTGRRGVDLGCGCHPTPISEGVSRVPDAHTRCKSKQLLLRRSLPHRQRVMCCSPSLGELM